MYSMKNVAKKIKSLAKLGLYKLLVLLVLMYGLYCAQIRRTDMIQLEKFQKKSVTWILSSRIERHFNQIKILNVWTLPMYIQLIDVLTPSKHKNDNSGHIVFPEIIELPERSKELFNLRKTRTEKTRGELVFKTYKIVNRLNRHKDFLTRRLKEIWNFVNEKICDGNICTWQLLRNCRTCRENWTIFYHKTQTSEIRKQQDLTKTCLVAYLLGHQIWWKIQDRKTIVRVKTNKLHKKFSYEAPKHNNKHGRMKKGWVPLKSHGISG